MEGMTGTGKSLWMRLNPAVPRHWLFAFAGVLWTVAGLILCLRGYFWIGSFRTGVSLSLEALGMMLAAFAYVYGFSRAVERNIIRIQSLPDHVCAFAFTAWKGYGMIGLMISAGILLRISPIPKYYLSVPYTTMGVILFIGSYRYYSHFVRLAVHRKTLAAREPGGGESR